MSLVIIGSLAFDTIETPLARKEKIVGGSGTYCALAASYFTKPKIVGVVGEDFPREMMSYFDKRRIDLDGVKIEKGKTFHWEARYDSNLNQRKTIKTELNVFKDFKPILPPDYRQAEIIFLGNVDPDQQDEIVAQAEQPKLVAMDTINLWIKSKPASLWKVLRKVDVFFANAEEIKMLTGEVNLIKAGKKILNRGPSFIIMKKGEHGALVLGKNFVFGALGYPCEKVVDPTGAGDCFAGGFLGYLDKINSYDKASMRKATVYGSVMASFVIEDFGIERLKKLSASEIKKRYNEFKKLVSF
ncbi:MAG: PfkB family carbohydrate kinase [Candidatus Aminicenantales bacterium]